MLVLTVSCVVHLISLKCGQLTCIPQLDSIPVDKITAWEAEFRSHLTAAQGSLLEEISTGNVTPEMEAKIKKVVEDHVSSFTW